MGNDEVMEGKKVVLVVDDNVANIFVLSTILKRMGFLVDEATSGMEAINSACEKNYDMIFMDHLMPDMDGIQAIRQILFITHGEKTPIIMGVSATVDESVVEAFHEVGATDVLEKPVAVEQLEAKLRTLGMLTGSNEVVEEQHEDGFDMDSVLSTINGLEYQKGLSLMAGSVENYMKVLQVCEKNVAENYSAIDVIKETDQVQRFALHFHSLKGIFLNIGADSLAEVSKELEMRAKDADSTYIHEHVTDYMQDVLTFNQQLGCACENYRQYCQKKNVGKTMTNSVFDKNMVELREHIEDFEYIEITELLGKMLASTVGHQKDVLSDVMDMVQEFEYDKALEILDSL